MRPLHALMHRVIVTGHHIDPLKTYVLGVFLGMLIGAMAARLFELVL